MAVKFHVYIPSSHSFKSPIRINEELSSVEFGILSTLTEIYSHAKSQSGIAICLLWQKLK